MEPRHHRPHRYVQDLGRVVVEEVVAFLERLGVGRALDATAAVDVQVREDPQEPRAEVCPGLEGLPAPKCPRVCLLHQILGLLTRRDEPAGDAVDLVGQLEGFLLEPDAVAGVFSQLPRLRFGCRLPHAATLATRLLRLQRRRTARHSRYIVPRGGYAHRDRNEKGRGRQWKVSRSSPATTASSAMSSASTVTT